MGSFKEMCRRSEQPGLFYQFLERAIVLLIILINYLIDMAKRNKKMIFIPVSLIKNIVVFIYKTIREQIKKR